MMRIGNNIKQLFYTINFFTCIPLPVRGDVGTGLEHMAVWTPWAGLVIAGGLIVTHSLAGWLFPPALAAACVLCVWVTLTGGLHLDGLGDCCDAFFAPVDANRRLEIMRDAHLGSFGVMGIGLTLLIKFCTLLVLPGYAWVTFSQSVGHFPFGLLFAPIAARWLVLWAARIPAVQPAGLGMTFARGVSLGNIVLAGILPFGLIVINGLPALASLVIAGVGVWMFTRIARAAIGGVTGDVFGACIEIGEVIILGVYSARFFNRF